jgi:hypothetical protein
MRPLIQDGDLLEVAPVRKATMALGDVFLFSDRGGRLMAHRLIHKYQHKGLLMLVLQGDANPREDLAVDDALIIGQVIRKKGPSGEFNFPGWLHRTIAWFFILFAPMIKRIYIRSKILSSQKL